jgi:hypothetical protein
MGGIDSSDMMLYTYLDEKQTMCYWEMVAFNIISHTVSIIEILGEKWLALKHNAGADDLRGSRGLRKLPEKEVSMHCLQHKGMEAESQNSRHQIQQWAAWRMFP